MKAKLVYRGVYHEHVKSTESGELLEDKIFHIVGGNQGEGFLVDKFEGGRNVWMKLTELEIIKKKYASCDIETQIGVGKQTFIEKVQIYSKDEF